VAYTRHWRQAVVAIGLMGMLACGDSNDGGGGSPLPPSGGGPGPSGATITISATGAVSPTTVSVTTGQSVTFVNNDTKSHQIDSNPHPTHTNCPSINAVDVIAAGQSKLSNAFTVAGTCGFHDHSEPNNAALQGTITIR
jgi:plastocyanin